SAGAPRPHEFFGGRLDDLSLCRGHVSPIFYDGAVFVHCRGEPLDGDGLIELSRPHGVTSATRATSETSPCEWVPFGSRMKREEAIRRSATRKPSTVIGP